MTARANLVGRTLADRFKVGAVIGEGAMAAVYRAVQEAEPREVALKVMHAHLTTDRTFVARFRREAKAAAQIDHPNSVRIIDWGVDGHVVFIAMELLTGRDLFDTLAVEGPLPSARAARIMIQVADALAAAHARGIVHRDLKPENIMLVPDPTAPDGERVKVLDFGIAKLLERDAPPSSDGPASSMGGSALTTVGMLVGTPGYMSPEQCRGDPIDARSDVYASGVVLYQMLTRRLPFDGDSIFEVAKQHGGAPPDRPTKWVPTIDGGLERVVLKAMAIDAAGRHASAVELKADLERVLARPGANAATAAPPSGSDPPTESFKSRPLATANGNPIETLRAPAADGRAKGFDAARAPRPAPAPAAAKAPAASPPSDRTALPKLNDGPTSEAPESMVTRPSFAMPGELSPVVAPAETHGAEPTAPAAPEARPERAVETIAVERTSQLPWDRRMKVAVMIALGVGMALGGGLVALLLR